MKLVTFEVSTLTGKQERIGSLIDSRIVDLNYAFARYLTNEKGESEAYIIADALVPNDMIKFFKMEERALEAAEKAVKYIEKTLKRKEEISGLKGERILYSDNEVKLLAPVPRPVIIRDSPCFEQHIINCSLPDHKVPELWYQLPAYFNEKPTNIGGHEDIIPWPSYTDLLDYEFELGMYIGRKGKDITKKNAEDHIAGYTIYNDISARDRQTIEEKLNMGPKGKGKDFDKSNIFGPCLVTKDEFSFKKSHKMIARVNGEIRTERDSKEMYWTWGDLIEYTSQDETLYPGEVFGSGTCGFGSCLEYERTGDSSKWLKPGDVIEFEVEGIDILRNTVGEKQKKRLWRGKY